MSFIYGKCKIIRDDLVEVEVKIEPVLNDGSVAAGCYSIYIGDDYQGQVCFQPEDKYAWEFISDKLGYREQEQIVVHIQTQL